MCSQARHHIGEDRAGPRGARCSRGHTDGEAVGVAATRTHAGFLGFFAHFIEGSLKDN